MNPSTPPMNPRESPEASSRWLRRLHRGAWVTGWCIEAPEDGKDEATFSRTQKEAWAKFFHPSLTLDAPGWRRAGFRAVKCRGRQKFAAFVAGLST